MKNIVYSNSRIEALCKRIALPLLALCFTIQAGAQNTQNSGTASDANAPMSSVNIQGTVSDESGAPLAGANVTVKGTTNGTSTNAQGNFSISAMTNATLVVSFLGMSTQEVNVGGRTRIDVEMRSSAQDLNEVVVMGYTSKTKGELSSSIVSLQADKLAGVTSSNVASMLQGKAAGVVVSTPSGEPGATPEILIRGAGSITAQAAPLYVVDGISGGSYNPNDVATLTVLKDAAATALYGSAAAGGVIIITTKHAKFNQPTQVEFKAIFGRKEVDNGNLKMMTGEELFSFQKQVMTPAIFEATRPLKLRRQNFDWMGAAFDPGFTQNYYLSVAKGNDNVRFRLSADWYDEDGALIGSAFKRLNMRANVSAKLHERVTLNVNVSYMHSHNDIYEWYMLEDAYKNMPWDNPYDSKHNLVFIDNRGVRPDGSPWYGNRKMNFLHNAQYKQSYFTGNGLVGDITLSVRITDYLTFESRNRGATDDGFQKRYVDPRVYDTEWATGKGFNSERNTVSYSLGTTDLLLLKKQWGDHALDAFVGFESGMWNSRYTEASVVDLPPLGLNALSIGTPYATGGSLVEGASISGLGQVQYSYKSKYIASASFRADASSAFGPKNRWGTFPAGSLAWILSEEDFVKGNKVFTFLKLRGSFGITGNSNIGQYKYLSNYAMTSLYNGHVAATAQNLANDLLGWESAWMSNIGVDIQLFKRVMLNIDLYNTDNKDLLLNVPVSPSTGFEYTLLNIGQVRNRGLEIQLSSDNLVGELKWTTDFNIAFNRNSVTGLPEGKAILQAAGGSTAVNQIVEEGEDIFTWYLPKWMGVNPADGTPQWEHIDATTGEKSITGSYADATYQKVGKASPKFTGGMMNTLSWKGIALSFNFNFLYKNLIYNQARESLDTDGLQLDINQMALADGWSRWQKPGDNATHPKPMANGNNNAEKPSSRQLEDGSYLRLRNVTLSYTLPQQWVRKAKMERVRIYISGDNLLTFTGYSGMDPEVSYQMAAWQLPGMQSFKYPLSKQFLAGLEITF